MYYKFIRVDTGQESDQRNVMFTLDTVYVQILVRVKFNVLS